jgi:hypothetical protein
MILSQKTITLERRYRYLRFDQRTPALDIDYEDGYLDEGQWKAVERGTFTISGDAARQVLAATPQSLQASGDNLGSLLDAASYAVLAGKFPTESVLSVKATDREGKPLVATFRLEKDGAVYAVSSGAEVVLRSPVLLNATLQVSAEGYAPVTVDFPVLAGEVEQILVLEALHE